MSAITFEQVKHLASLALIEMTDEELTAMASELDVIVASVGSKWSECQDYCCRELNQQFAVCTKWFAE